MFSSRKAENIACVGASVDALCRYRRQGNLVKEFACCDPALNGAEKTRSGWVWGGERTQTDTSVMFVVLIYDRRSVAEVLSGGEGSGVSSHHTSYFYHTAAILRSSCCLFY